MKTLFMNGKIASLDKNNSYHQAIGIKENIIVFLGSNEDAKKITSEYDEVIFLGQKVMLPGFNDSHMHLLNYGYTLEKVDLSKYNSLEDMIIGCTDFLNVTEIHSGGWLLCLGWNQDRVKEKRFPTKKDLDKISMDVPILFTRVCGHIAICNTKALELLDFNQIDPSDKNINISEGYFQEDALFILLDAIPSPSIEDIKRMIKITCKNLLANGITSVQSDDLKAMPDQDYNKVLTAYNELREEGNLSVRVFEQCLFINKNEFKTFIDKGYYPGLGDDFFKIGPLKLLLDGSLGGRTALLNNEYSDAPGVTGISGFNQKELNDFVDFAQANNFQIAAHAIGDKAMDMILDAFEQSENFKPNEDNRHGIVHCQITNKHIMNRMKNNNILAYIQPIFLDYDVHIVNERVGERSNESYAFNTMKNLGIKICMGTDSPVVDINPFENIYSAVVRKDLKGMPTEPYLPKEKLTVFDAIKAYTVNSAYSSFDENKKGTLEIGKFADMVVLDKDIFIINEEDIKNVSVLMTIVDGKLKYKK